MTTENVVENKQETEMERIEKEMRMYLSANFYPVPDMRNAKVLAEAYLNVLDFKPGKKVGEPGGKMKESIELLNHARFDMDDAILDLMDIELNEDDIEECCETCGQNVGRLEYDFNCQLAFEEYDNIAKDKQVNTEE